MVREVIVRLVDEIEDYITEVREYRANISDTAIYEVFTEYLMDKSEFIEEILDMRVIELPTWVVIDEDKTLHDMNNWGFEFIEYHGLVFPGWCLEPFLNDLERLEDLEEVE